MSKPNWYTPASAIQEAADQLERTADFLLYGHGLDMDTELSPIEVQMMLQLVCNIQQAQHSAAALALAVKACKKAKENA